MLAKDMPPEVRRVHDLLLRVERYAIHALLISRGIRPGSEAGRLWYWWIKTGVRKAHKAFGDPTREEVAVCIGAEVKRALEKASPR